MSEDKKLLVVIYLKKVQCLPEEPVNKWYYFIELQKIHFVDQTFNSNKEIFVAYKKVT